MGRQGRLIDADGVRHRSHPLRMPIAVLCTLYPPPMRVEGHHATALLTAVQWTAERIVRVRRIALAATNRLSHSSMTLPNGPQPQELSFRVQCPFV